MVGSETLHAERLLLTASHRRRERAEAINGAVCLPIAFRLVDAQLRPLCTETLGHGGFGGINHQAKVDRQRRRVDRSPAGAWHLSVGTAGEFDRRLTPSSEWYTIRLLAEGASQGTGSLEPTSVAQQVVGGGLQGQENLLEMREQQARRAIYTGFYGGDIVPNDAQALSACGLLTPRCLSFHREIGAPLQLLSVAGASSNVLTGVAA